jgi:hypothetical protein
VFSYEYQGYGISKPQVKTTEARVCASIEAAVQYLVEDKKIPYNKIIVYVYKLVNSQIGLEHHWELDHRHISHRKKELILGELFYSRRSHL